MHCNADSITPPPPPPRHKWPQLFPAVATAREMKSTVFKAKPLIKRLCSSCWPGGGGAARWSDHNQACQRVQFVSSSTCLDRRPRTWRHATSTHLTSLSLLWALITCRAVLLSVVVTSCQVHKACSSCGDTNENCFTFWAVHVVCF